MVPSGLVSGPPCFVHSKIKVIFLKFFLLKNIFCLLICLNVSHGFLWSCDPVPPVRWHFSVISVSLAHLQCTSIWIRLINHGMEDSKPLSYLGVVVFFFSRLVVSNTSLYCGFQVFHHSRGRWKHGLLSRGMKNKKTALLRNLHWLRKKENQYGSSSLLLICKLFTWPPFVSTAAHWRQSQSMSQVLGETEGTFCFPDGLLGLNSPEWQQLNCGES